MTTTSSTTASWPASPASRRAGIVLSALAVAVLFVDGVAQILATPNILHAAAEVGYPTAPLFWQGVGAALVVSTLLYAIPRTAVFGAVLVTGYLGGAISAHVRVGTGAVPPIVVALAIAAVVWGGLWLRDERLRALTRAR